MPRLFIYYAEAMEKEEPNRSILTEQFKIMQRRLWFGITLPSSIMAPTFALYLLMPWKILENDWLVLKLIFVIGLYLYQYYLHCIFKEQRKNISKHSSMKLRAINEIATIFLVAIVFLVVMKNTVSYIYGLIGLLFFILVLVLGIIGYRKLRSQP
jgi:putative membrane protein